MYYSCYVSYKYRKEGKSSWTVTSHLVQQLKAKSETLLMQKLRDQHKGCEIQLVKFEWK